MKNRLLFLNQVSVETGTPQSVPYRPRDQLLAGMAIRSHSVNARHATCETEPGKHFPEGSC